MKKLFTFLFVIAVSVTALNAQDAFQGTLKYDFKMMGEGVEQFQAMLPTGMEMAVRKSDMTVEIQGGMAAMMMGKILVKGKKGKSYMIKDSEETIYVMDPKKNDDGADDVKPEITKEDETINIAGYECQKYKVTTETAQGPVTQYVWVTEKLKMPEMKGNASMGGMGSSLSVKGLPGMALKTMAVQGPMTIIVTATKVDKNVPDKSNFKLPKGYSKEEFDMNSMMGGMGGGM